MWVLSKSCIMTNPKAMWQNLLLRLFIIWMLENKYSSALKMCTLYLHVKGPYLCPITPTKWIQLCFMVLDRKKKSRVIVSLCRQIKGYLLELLPVSTCSSHCVPTELPHPPGRWRSHSGKSEDPGWAAAGYWGYEIQSIHNSFLLTVATTTNRYFHL